MFQFKFLNELNQCLKTINDGGIILHPTDTVYGLGGNANDNNVTRKINQIHNYIKKENIVINEFGK